MITVLTRTSRRPVFFAECLRSVQAQSVKPYHIISSDDPEDTYALGKGDHLLHIPAQHGRGSNLYLNMMRRYIPKKSPWVMFLDDDDHFTDIDAVKKIQNNIRSEDDLLLWQVQFPHGLVPGLALGHAPSPGNITGIGFCFHSKHWIDWVSDSFGDYFVIAQLYMRLNPVWIDEVLTGLQSSAGHGLRRDLGQ